MIRVVQIGIGPLGQRMVKFALERGGFEFVGAVDPSPEKAGKDLGELAGLPPLGVEVKPSLKVALHGRSADAAILTTVSDMARIEPQVAELAAAGLNVVSTCEEMVYPWRTDPVRARNVDAACRAAGVTCLSTGVNPGFLMDFLPCALAGVCQRVDKVVVRRVQDASVRRVPFQMKIGAALTMEEFERKRLGGTLRHVGLTESIHMLAARLGWELDRVTESLEPIVAKERIRGGYAVVEPGMAAGVLQIGRAFRGEKEVITLEFRAAVGEPQSFDSVEIVGSPNFQSLIPGGINGDIATCAIVLNSLPGVLRAEPGLKTMIDLPAPAWSMAD